MKQVVTCLYPMTFCQTEMPCVFFNHNGAGQNLISASICDRMMILLLKYPYFQWIYMRCPYFQLFACSSCKMPICSMIFWTKMPIWPSESSTFPTISIILFTCSAIFSLCFHPCSSSSTYVHHLFQRFSSSQPPLQLRCWRSQTSVRWPATPWPWASWSSTKKPGENQVKNEVICQFCIVF